MREISAKSRRVYALALIAIVIIATVCLIIFRENVGGFFASIGDYMSYAFVRRALIAGVSVALCAAILGVTLVLKRYSMIGDGLSHGGFGALAIAMALGSVPETSVFHAPCRWISENPMIFTTIAVMVMAFLLLRLSASARIKGDAAIAMISAGALAVGVMVISVVPGMNVDIGNYMFGSILSVSQSDATVTLCACAAIAIIYVIFYRKIFAITFDEVFAEATGARAKIYNMIIAMLTAVVVVMGMRLMGTMLISSLLIFPALSAMRVFARFRQVVICAAIISVVCFVIGLFISCAFSLPAGAGVVMVNLITFIVFTLIGRVRGVD